MGSREAACPVSGIASSGFEKEKACPWEKIHMQSRYGMNKKNYLQCNTNAV